MMIGRAGAKNKVICNMEGKWVTSSNPTLSHWHPNGGGYVRKKVGKTTLSLSKGDQAARNDWLIQGDKLVVTKD